MTIEFICAAVSFLSQPPAPLSRSQSRLPSGGAQACAPKDDPQVGHDARHRSSPVFPHPRGGRPLLRGAIEQAIRDVGVAINQIDDAIDVKVARQGSADDQERDYALCVSFVDDASLRQFISTTLPVIKRQSKLLWKGLVTPVEATVD